MQIFWERSGKIPHLEREEAALIKLKNRNPQSAVSSKFHIIEATLRELDIAYYTARLRPAPKLNGELRVTALSKRYLMRTVQPSMESLGAFLASYNLTVYELLYFPLYLKAAAISMMVDADEDMTDKLLCVLRVFSESDGRALLLEQSKLCKELSKSDDFLNSDEETRIACLRAASSYARKRKMSESEAGEALIKEGEIFKLLKKNRQAWVGIAAIFAMSAAILFVLYFLLLDSLAVLLAVPLAFIVSEVFISDFVFSHFAPAFLPRKSKADGKIAVLLKADNDIEACEIADSMLRASIAAPEAACIYVQMPEAERLAARLNKIELKERIAELQSFTHVRFCIYQSEQELKNFDYLVTLPIDYELQPDCVKKLVATLAHNSCNAAVAVPHIEYRSKNPTLFSRIFYPTARFAALSETLESVLHYPSKGSVSAIKLNCEGEAVAVRDARCIAPSPENAVEYVRRRENSRKTGRLRWFISASEAAHAAAPLSMAILMLYSAICTGRAFLVLLVPISYAMLFPVLSFNRELWAMLASYGKGAALRDFWIKARVTLVQGVVKFALFPARIYSLQTEGNSAMSYYKSFVSCAVLSGLLFVLSSKRLGGLLSVLAIFFAFAPLIAHSLGKSYSVSQELTDVQRRKMRQYSAKAFPEIMNAPYDAESASLRMLAVICAFRMCYIDAYTAISLIEETTHYIESIQGKNGLFSQTGNTPSEINGFAACTLITVRWAIAWAVVSPQRMYDIWEAFLDLAEETGSEDVLSVFRKYYKTMRFKVKYNEDVTEDFNAFLKDLSQVCTDCEPLCVAAKGFVGREDVPADRAADIIERLDKILVRMKLCSLFDSPQSLASIANQGSRSWLALFAAIVKGELPSSEWNKISRPVAMLGVDRVLISKHANPADYFLAHMFVPYYEDALLTNSAKTAARAIRTGRSEHISYLNATEKDMEYSALACEIDPELALNVLKDMPQNQKAACISIISVSNAISTVKTSDDFMRDPSAAVFSELIRERAPKLGVVISASK